MGRRTDSVKFLREAARCQCCSHPSPRHPDPTLAPVRVHSALGQDRHERDGQAFTEGPRTAVEGPCYTRRPLRSCRRRPGSLACTWQSDLHTGRFLRDSRGHYSSQRPKSRVQDPHLFRGWARLRHGQKTPIGYMGRCQPLVRECSCWGATPLFESSGGGDGKERLRSTM